MNGTVYVAVGQKADGTFCFHNFKSFGDATIIHPADRKKLRLKAERLKKLQEIRRHRIYKRAFQFPVGAFLCRSVGSHESITPLQIKAAKTV